MANIKYNSNEIKKIVYNGTNIDKLNINGELVWKIPISIPVITNIRVGTTNDDLLITFNVQNNNPVAVSFQGLVYHRNIDSSSGNVQENINANSSKNVSIIAYNYNSGLDKLEGQFFYNTIAQSEIVVKYFN